MTQQFDEYNPRLIITDHFDKIKNELDIKVETILHENRKLNEKERIEINAMRDNQINKIKEIEHMNLSEWPSNFDKEIYEHEWADLISSKSLSDGQKIERIKGSIIKSDVILVDDSFLKTRRCRLTRATIQTHMCLRRQLHGMGGQ